MNTAIQQTKRTTRSFSYTCDGQTLGKNGARDPYHVVEPIHAAHAQEASIAVPTHRHTCDREESNAGQGGPVRALEAEADGGEQEEHKVQRDLSARTFLIAAQTSETYADYLGELLLLGAERAAE